MATEPDRSRRLVLLGVAAIAVAIAAALSIRGGAPPAPPVAAEPEVVVREAPPVESAPVTATSLQAPAPASPPAPEAPTVAALVPAAPTRTATHRARIEGLVCDSASAPIAGARVERIDPRQPGTGADPFVAGADEGVLTGADGRYSLEVDPGRHTLRALRAGFKPGSAAPVVVAPGEVEHAEDIVLERLGAGALRVRASLADGTPYGGKLRVWATSVAGPLGAARSSWSADFQLGKDGVGAPELPMTIGRYSLRPSARGFEGKSVEVVVREGEVAEASYTLTKVPVLVIRVVDDETGDPVAGASLTCDDASADSLNSIHYRTDAEGTAAIRDVRAGRCWIAVRKEGYIGNALGRGDVAGLTPKTYEIGEDEMARGLEVRLLRGLDATGRVVDPEGRPVGGASVVAVSGVNVTWGSAQADGDGTFRVRGLGTGKVSLVATAAGWGFASVPVEITEATPPRDVVIALVRGGRIEGRVTDGRGAAVVGAHVIGAPWIDLPGPPGRPANPEMQARMRRESRPSSHAHDGRARQAWTDGDGAFALDALPAGPVDLMATAEGLSPVLRRDVDVRPGETTRADLAAPGALPIEGVVVDDAGQPIPGALVFYGTEQGYGSARTEADGRFRLDAVPAADGEAARVTISTLDHEIESRQLVPGGPAVVVTLKRACTVQLTIQVPPGATFPARGDCRIFGPGGRTSSEPLTLSSPPGCAVRRVPAGATRLEVSCPGFQPARIDLPPMTPGVIQPLSVALQPTAPPSR